MTDYNECLAVDDGSGGTFDICGLTEVDADNYYVLDDVTTHPIHGYIIGGSSWLEDTPNLDPSLFLEGVP